jgi:hypothetical protein
LAIKIYLRASEDRQREIMREEGVRRDEERRGITCPSIGS